MNIFHLHILVLVLIVSVYSNDTINLIRCVYRNFVPNVKLIFDIIDAIKDQSWMTVISLASTIYIKIKDILTLCKAETLSLK